MEITFNPNVTPSYLYYSYLKDNDINRINGEGVCYSGVPFSSYENKKYRYFLIRSNREYSTYDTPFIIWWVMFMNECGFPCSFQETQKEYTIVVDYKDYNNKNYFFVALTAIRFIFYGRGIIHHLPKRIYEIKTMFPKWNSFRIVLMAHISLFDAYIDKHHCLCEAKLFELITKTELIRRAKKRMYMNANETCCKSIECEGHNFNSLHELLKKHKKENYETVYKLLTKNKRNEANKDFYC